VAQNFSDTNQSTTQPTEKVSESSTATNTATKENWKKFWKVMALMPLWFIMPLTAFGKMQEILSDPSDPANQSKKTPSEE